VTPADARRVTGAPAAAPRGRPGPAPPGEDDERLWLAPLQGAGAARAEALGRLHALLLRAATFEVGRRRGTVPGLRGGELDDIALQAADDAMLGVLRRLGDFRGDSRFTTWAYKFALLEAAVALRRRAWQGRETPLAEGAWERMPSPARDAQETAEQAELLAEVRHAVVHVLTPHQRDVLVALAIDGVPIDVLADRLGTTRGALYKTLHDGRRRLRAHLAGRGLGPDGGGTG